MNSGAHTNAKGSSHFNGNENRSFFVVVAVDSQFAEQFSPTIYGAVHKQ